MLTKWRKRGEVKPENRLWCGTIKILCRPFFIVRQIISPFCLIFFTICADKVCYKVSNMCYKLCNMYYKLCNMHYKLCNKNFFIG